MKTRFFCCALLICLLIMAAATPIAMAERSYSFPEVEITAEVLRDGSMVVSERRTVRFNGTYTGLYQWIHKKHGMAIVNVKVSENDLLYKFNPGSDYGPPGTFLIIDQPDSLYVDWSFAAANEVRTFTLSYQVLNAVQVHNDVAELYYQFIGDQWEVPAQKARVQLTIPGGAGNGQVQAWGHGPLHGEVNILSPQVITWEVSPFPQRTFLEGRVTFPPELVPGSTNRSGKYGLATILAEEEKWASKANFQRTLARADLYAAPLILLVALLVALFFWHRYGREHGPSFQGDYYRELHTAPPNWECCGASASQVRQTLPPPSSTWPEGATCSWKK